MIGLIPIPKMLNAINRTETLAPILDPTAFIKNGKKMEEDKKMLESLLPAWQMVNKIKVELFQKARNMGANNLIAMVEEYLEISKDA